MLAMLDTLAKEQHTAQVNWFHAAENGDVHAFADEVSELGRTLPRFTAHTWYREPTEADRAQRLFDSEGLMDLSKLEAAFTACEKGTFTQGLLDCPGELFQASGELAGLSGRYTYEFSQEEALLHLDFV